LVDIVADELNVKALEFVSEAGKLVNYRVLPNNKLLGKKFGQQFPTLRAALAELNPAQVAATVTSGENLNLQLSTGEAIELTPEEIVVETQPAEGYAVAADKVVTVGIDATLTPELKAEGLAREIVRRIQDMRKKAGFNIEDRITTWYVAVAGAGGELAGVLETWGEYVKAETLTTELVAGEPGDGAFVEEQKVEGEVLLVGVRRN
jgi:isoleucyl-tRNA synthetase